MAEISQPVRRPGVRARFAKALSIVARSPRRLATAAVAILAGSVAYHVVFGPNGLTVFEQKRQETQALAAEMKQLQQENDVLQSHVGHLQTDPDAIEHEAREQLHYARPGEVIYRLDDPAAPSDQPLPATSNGTHEAVPSPENQSRP